MLLTGDLLEGLVAVPVGGGRARAGLEIDHSEPQARVWRSRGRAAAHRHTQRPGSTGVEGAWKTRGAKSNMRNHAGYGCGARGRRRGLAGLRDDAPSRRLAARTASGRAAHGHIKQPEQAKPAAASSVGGGQIQGFDGGLEGGGCLLVLV